MDRSRWRKQIGMIDDHSECEWVNVSSGTGSPGLSRTKSIESYNGCTLWSIKNETLLFF